MRISELQLSNLVKHYLIREYKERGVESMCIKEFLPLCAALLFPYKDLDISKNDKINGTIIPIIDSVRKHTKSVKGLTNYTREGLRLYFKNIWLPSLSIEKQISLIKNISLVDQVEEDGYFSIKGNEKVYEIYLHKIDILDISQNYGTEMYIEPNHEIGENIGISTNEDMKPVNNSETNEKKNEFVSLEPLKEFLQTTFPLSKFPNGLKTYDFFWKYKLNNDQYLKLKDILIKFDFANNKKKGLLNKEICGSAYGTVALVVALYISEWYKRESITLSGDRCLETIGLTSQKTEQIWKSSGLSEELLHQDEDENQMRQMAICALGGLPIGYVNSSARFKEFVNGLSEIYNTENETTDDEIERIVNCFDDNNGVFKRSLKSGSCKEYLIKLIEYLESGDKSDLPFCESDLEIPLFAEFVNNLKEGYDKDLPKRFFKTEIRIWTYDYIEEGDDSNSIEGEFYVHIGCGKDENKNVITKRELSKLGVFFPNETDRFVIHLQLINEDGSIIEANESRTYFKIGNNCEDFCAAHGSELTTSVDFFNLKKVVVILKCEGYQKEIYSYSLSRYIELFSNNNAYLFTTKTNNTASKVLFYDKAAYTLQNEENLDVRQKSDGENDWGWLYQKEDVCLLDKNNEIIDIPLGASEQIMVDYRTRSLKKDVALTSDGCVRSVIDGQFCGYVPLLYYSEGQELMLWCDGFKGRQLTDRYKIEYKDLNETRYTEWKNANRPSQGFIKLRIRCLDSSLKKRVWTSVVYFIPQKSIIERNVQNNYIYFKGENICPLDNALKDAFNTKKNRFHDSPDHGLQSPTISFRIGDDNNHVIVDVYRAFKWKQVWNKDSLIKNIIEGDKPPVANILHKNIKIKTIDEDGYKECLPNYFGYANYFEDPKDIAFYKKGDIQRGFSINDPDKEYTPYIYLNRFDDRSQGEVKARKIERIDNYIYLKVSDRYIDKYKFYYWSGELNEDPVILEREYLGERSYRYSIPKPLEGKAVVFQSMRDDSPNFYFRPFYFDKWKWNNYMNRYGQCNIDYLIKCFNLSAEHKIYGCIFPALRLLQDRGKFTEFIRSYFQYKNYHLAKKDITCLTYLAKELAMDWFFINRNIFFSRQDENSKLELRKCMKSLLLNSPIERGEHAYSIRFINRFLENSNAFNKRDGVLARQFLKVLDTFKYQNQRNDLNDIQVRIEFLNELVSSNENIFKKICDILNI